MGKENMGFGKACYDEIPRKYAMVSREWGMDIFKFLPPFLSLLHPLLPPHHFYNETCVIDTTVSSLTPHWSHTIPFLPSLLISIAPLILSFPSCLCMNLTPSPSMTNLNLLDLLTHLALISSYNLNVRIHLVLKYTVNTEVKDLRFVLFFIP